MVRDAWSLCPDPKQWIQVPVFPNEPLTKPFPLHLLQINVDSFLFINFFSPIASYYFLARVTRPALSLNLSDDAARRPYEPPRQPRGCPRPKFTPCTHPPRQPSPGASRSYNMVDLPIR